MPQMASKVFLQYAHELFNAVNFVVLLIYSPLHSQGKFFFENAYTTSEGRRHLYSLCFRKILAMLLFNRTIQS